MKAIEIMKKNLKTFTRDKKSLLIVFSIPIVFYIMMGLIFGGGTMSNVNLSAFTVGYVNLDSDTAVEPIYPARSLGTIINTLENMSSDSSSENDLFKVQNYTMLVGNHPDFNASYQQADKALVQGNIIAFVVFDQNFQAAINNASVVKIGFFDNDSTIYAGYDPRFKCDFLFNLLEDNQYLMVNLTSTDFTQAINDFKSNDYDYILRVNEGYEANLNSSGSNLTLYSRDGENAQKLQIQITVLQSIFRGAIFQNTENPSLTIFSEVVINSGFIQEPSYTIYFLQSTSAITRNIINQTFNGIVSGIINYDPNSITFNITAENTGRVALNTLTTSAPGLLLYGAMNVMSFATIMLTNEVANGHLRRLKSSRMTNLDLLLGNLLVNLILVSIQILVGLLIFYALGFNPFFTSIGSFILGLILNTLVIGLFINGLALALTSVLKTPEAAGGGVWIVLIPMMMFSGVFFPLELMSPELAAAFAWLPTRMAVLCFQAIFVEGLSVLSTKFLTNFFGQLGAGLGLFALGLWLFGKFSSTSPSELRRKKKIPLPKANNSNENTI